MSVNLVNQTDASLAPIAGGTLYADEPIGAILPFGGSTVPNGFLLCNGAAVSRTTYAELFEVIGTSFGAGDGSTTFNVPDLRGKVPVGYNSSESEFNALGKTGGEKTHQLTITEMPTHSHTPKNASSQNMTLIGDSNGNNPIPVYSSSTSYAKTGFTYLANTGGDGAHNNLQPYNTVNYIIKATTIALPSNFETAVDDKIATNMIDSVTDGSQKAITSNAVFDQLKNFCMTVQASGSLTIEPNSQQGISLTYTCPQGYTPILAVPRSAGSWAWVWSYCYLQDTSHVYAVIRSVNSFQETQTISANVLCVRTYS